MPNGNINGHLASHGHIAGVLTIGSGGGTSDYDLLENKPQINGHELIDNQTAHELGLASMQDVSDIESDIALLSQKLPKNYSTTEQNTGVKWIDGKYIYKRTLTQNEVPAFANTGTSRNINLGLTGIDHIWLHPLSAAKTLPFPYIHNNTSNIIGYFWDMNNGNPILNIRTGSSSSSEPIDYITILYTKNE